MRILGRTGLKVFPIALGTVELGYTYGIGPRQLPSEEEAISLLKSAVERGVNFFDTAHFYGVAEERIAQSGIAKYPNVIIATKCGHDIEKKKDIASKELAVAINKEVDESRARLQMSTLTIAMVHGGSAEQIRNGMITEIMGKLKAKSKVRFVGISTRGEEAARAAIESGFFDCVQIGYSIFDQRQSKTNLALAQGKNIGIIARSIFLKGALTPRHVHLVPQLQLLKDKYAELEKIAERLGHDVPTLALRFALANPTISTVLVGTQSIEHLEKSLAAAALPPLPPAVIETLVTFAIDDPNYVDPSYWPTAAHSDDKSKIVRHFDAK